MASNPGGKLIAQVREEEEAARDAQPTTTKCALCAAHAVSDFDEPDFTVWELSGTFAETREAFAKHLSEQHPEAAKLAARRGAGKITRIPGRGAPKSADHARALERAQTLADRHAAGEITPDEQAELARIRSVPAIPLEEPKEPIRATESESARGDACEAEDAHLKELIAKTLADVVKMVDAELAEPAAAPEPAAATTVRRRRVGMGSAYGRDEIIALFRAFHERHGRWPTSKDCGGSSDIPAKNTIYKLFPLGWASALEAARAVTPAEVRIAAVREAAGLPELDAPASVDRGAADATGEAPAPELTLAEWVERFPVDDILMELDRNAHELNVLQARRERLLATRAIHAQLVEMLEQP